MLMTVAEALRDLASRQMLCGSSGPALHAALDDLKATTS
jgi:hypothetical protein